jgi:hypothetical protein
MGIFAPALTLDDVHRLHDHCVVEPPRRAVVEAREFGRRHSDTKESSMTDTAQNPDETQEGVGTPVVDSDYVEDQYELNDVVDADYYATDDTDDDSGEVTA